MSKNKQLKIVKLSWPGGAMNVNNNASSTPLIMLKCRTCLGEFDEDNMHNLFEEQEDEVESLGEQIEFCCGIRVRQSAQMPPKICSRCWEFVRMWFNFRNCVLNAQVFWESSCLDGEQNELDLAYLYEKLQEDEELKFETVSQQEQIDFDEDVAALIDEDDTAVETFFTGLEPQFDPDLGEKDEVDIGVQYPEHEQITLNEAELDSTDDFLSPAPSPTVKRKPGRPRKPDNELKSKRKDKISESQAKDEGEEDVKYMCNLCGNFYHKKSAFTAHMTAHTDYKPHQCEICYKSFRQMGELRAHIRRHTGERPYKCLYCERRFYDRSEKVRHERVHTNTRPYACKVCGKTFTHTTILKNHSLVHSGEKNFSCAVCSKSFTLLHQLKAHLQTLTHRSRAEQGLAPNSGFVLS